LTHLSRFQTEGGELKRALEIGLSAQPPRFPAKDSAARSPDGRKRLKVTWGSPWGGDSARDQGCVHGFYLGSAAPGDRFKNRQLVAFVWGPQQLLELVEGPLRAPIVECLLSASGNLLAYTLEPSFLAKLEADEQKSLLLRLNQSPDIFRAWATAEHLNVLTLPAKKCAGELLLPAVASLSANVREIVMSMALG